MARKAIALLEEMRKRRRINDTTIAGSDLDAEPVSLRLAEESVGGGELFLRLTGNGPVLVDLLLRALLRSRGAVKVKGDPADVGDVTETILKRRDSAERKGRVQGKGGRKG
jgi:hypothetical protein